MHFIQKMKLKTIYGLAGAMWGLLLGGLGGAVLIVYAFGFSWLFLFGDDTWPDSSNQVISFLGLFFFILAFLLGSGLGWFYGRRLDKMVGANAHKLRKRGFLWLGIGIGVSISLIASMYLSDKRQTEDRLQGQIQETNFSQFQEEIYVITNITFSGWQDGEGEIEITFDGSREGKYQLSWALKEQGFSHAIQEGDGNLFLGNGSQSTEIILNIEQISESYSEVVLAGEGGVLVEEAFLFTATLEPVLNESEIKSLPKNEIQNLERGFSSLDSKLSTEIPIRFFLQKK